MLTGRGHDQSVGDQVAQHILETEANLERCFAGPEHKHPVEVRQAILAGTHDDRSPVERHGATNSVSRVGR